MITPLRDFILIERIAEKEEASPAGVIRIRLQDEKNIRGRVVATGPDAKVPMHSTVLFSIYNTIDVEDTDEKKYLLVPEKEVFAVVG